MFRLGIFGVLMLSASWAFAAPGFEVSVNAGPTTTAEGFGGSGQLGAQFSLLKWFMLDAIVRVDGTPKWGEDAAVTTSLGLGAGFKIRMRKSRLKLGARWVQSFDENSSYADVPRELGRAFELDRPLSRHGFEAFLGVNFPPLWEKGRWALAITADMHAGVSGVSADTYQSDGLMISAGALVGLGFGWNH